MQKTRRPKNELVYLPISSHFWLYPPTIFSVIWFFRSSGFLYIWSDFWSSGFLFIQSSGFSLTVMLVKFKTKVFGLGFVCKKWDSPILSSTKYTLGKHVELVDLKNITKNLMTGIESVKTKIFVYTLIVAMLILNKILVLVLGKTSCWRYVNV